MAAYNITTTTTTTTTIPTVTVAQERLSGSDHIVHVDAAISVLGLVTNSLCLVVLVRHYRAGSSSAIFLLGALAVTDFLYSLNTLSRWTLTMANLQWTLVDYPTARYLQIVISNIVHAMASWMVVMVAFDR